LEAAGMEKQKGENIWKYASSPSSSWCSTVMYIYKQNRFVIHQNLEAAFSSDLDAEAGRFSGFWL
jgi:hypothetical protein